MGIGDFISGIFGSKNNYQAPAQGAYQPDQSLYQYGGRPGGAADQAGYYATVAANAHNRAAPQANFQYAQPDYSQQGAYSGNAEAARGWQNNVANLMYQRATGAVPSIAGQQAAVDRAALQRQAQEQNRLAVAGQSALSASARGSAATALAQQNAANNVANAQGAIGTSEANAEQGIAQQAQVNAAQERLAAEGAAENTFSGIRNQDLAAADSASQRAQADAALRTGQAEFNPQLQDTTTGQNDAAALGYDTLGNQVQTNQLGASENYGAQRSANANSAMAVNAGVAGQNANTNQSNAMGVVGLATGTTAGLVGGPPKTAATGAHVRAGEPVIVGDAPGNPFRSGGAELFLPRGRHPGINPTVAFPRELPPVYAPPAGARTWGVGAGTTPEEAAAVGAQNAARVEGMERQFAGPGPMAYASPLEVQKNRDEETLMGAGARRAEGLESTPKEEQAARSARYRLKQDAKIEKEGETAALSKAEAAKPPPGWAQRIGEAGRSLQEQAGKVDTAYHGPTSGYIPPQLIAPRAAGGPVGAGDAYLVGEQGPELIVPPTDGTVIPAAPTAALLSAGGGLSSHFGTYAGSGPGDPWAYKNPMQQAAKSAFSNVHQSGGMAGAYGREDGGPVGAGDKVVVGEKGPELVVPKPREMKTFERGPSEERRKADAASARADEETAKGVAQMLSPIPGSAAPAVVNVGRGIVDNGRAMAGWAAERKALAERPVFVQQGKPQGEKRAPGVIGASVPEEPLPEGVAPAVHPLPAPPAMAVASEPRYRWEGDRLVLDDVAPPGPSPLPPPKAPPIEAPAPAKPSVADTIIAMRHTTGATHRSPARKRQ